MASEMTVDQLLAQQQEVRPLATIEPVEGKQEVVKVTPWHRSTGCLCGTAILLAKSMIASVKPTGDTHYCCGKQLEVVEVTFKKDAQLPVAEVFAQAASGANPVTKAGMPHQHAFPHHPSPRGGSVIILPLVVAAWGTDLLRSLVLRSRPSRHNKVSASPSEDHRTRGPGCEGLETPTCWTATAG